MRQLPSESFRFITRNCNGTEKVAVDCHVANFSSKLRNAEASFEGGFAPDHRSNRGIYVAVSVSEARQCFLHPLGVVYDFIAEEHLHSKTCCMYRRSAASFDRYGLRQIARFVHIRAFGAGCVVRQQLQRYHVQDGA
jgi:hypothetical protein